MLSALALGPSLRVLIKPIRGVAGQQGPDCRVGTVGPSLGLGLQRAAPQEGRGITMEVTAISGFPEWLPAEKLLENRIIEAIRSSCELYGFTPVETPAAERLEVLDAKGGVGRQIFKITRPAMEEDSENAALALHFDLTVPLARYVVQHAESLAFPFRRYQIQKVWRGERAQRGRFREFYQADIDIIGRGDLAVMYDAEIPVAISEVYRNIGAHDFEIHISNRKILTDLFHAIAPPLAETGLMRIVDGYHKTTEDGLLQSLVNEGLNVDNAERTLALCKATDVEGAAAILAEVGADTRGIEELRTVLESTLRLGMDPDRITLDFSIARGLDYYTGTVFETFIRGHESWGSICSGGRYDNLAESFGSNVSLPGVGISLGLTRLLQLMLSEGIVSSGASSPARVLVTNLSTSEKALSRTLEASASLRKAGIPTEVFFKGGKLGDQLAHASRLGIPIAVIMGVKEITADEVSIRDLRNRDQVTVPIDRLTHAVRTLLDGR